MRYLTVKDIADLLGQNEETIRRKIRAGKIPAERGNEGGGYRIPTERLIKDTDLTAAQLDTFLSQKAVQPVTMDWTEVLANYQNGHIDQMTALLSLTKALQQINAERSNKDVQAGEFLQRYNLLANEVRGLDLQINQIMQYLSILGEGGKDNG